MKSPLTEEVIARTMVRLHLNGADERYEAVRILREWDYNGGDVDDLLDRYEDEEVY